MRYTIILLTLILIATQASAQGNSTRELQKMYENDEFDKIIQVSVDPGKYDAEALFYLSGAYAATNKPDKAVVHMNKLLTLLDKKDPQYQTTLFNLAMMEYQLGQYEKAAGHYTELISIAPDDYHAHAKLIQVHYAQRQYFKAKPLKKTLYDAHSKGLLKDNLKDMYCFDQFKWRDKTIQVFERFQDDEGDRIYKKHIFYVVNKDDKIDYKIQTEYSPMAKEIGGYKYVLCTANVMKILEGKAEPVASSRPSK